MEWTKENSTAVGKIPSGLFIVTAGSTDKQLDGYLASWVQQISFEPLMLSVAIKPGRPCYDIIKSDGGFTINVVGKKNSSIMKPFWSGYDPDESPFNTLDNSSTKTGGVIIKGALAGIECKKTQIITEGDHEIIFANVIQCHTLETDDEPMVHIRKSGIDY